MYWAVATLSLQGILAFQLPNKVAAGRNIASWFRKLWDRYGPARRLIVVEGDSLPKKLPRRNLVLARDDQ